VTCEDGTTHREDGSDEQDDPRGDGQADATVEMSIPEHDPPSIVDGCGVNEEEGDNNDEHGH
jgi:hypothetical protein